MEHREAENRHGDGQGREEAPEKKAQRRSGIIVRRWRNYRKDTDDEREPLILHDKPSRAVTPCSPWPRWVRWVCGMAFCLVILTGVRGEELFQRMVAEKAHAGELVCLPVSGPSCLSAVMQPEGEQEGGLFRWGIAANNTLVLSVRPEHPWNKTQPSAVIKSRCAGGDERLFPQVECVRTSRGPQCRWRTNNKNGYSPLPCPDPLCVSGVVGRCGKTSGAVAFLRNHSVWTATPIPPLQPLSIEGSNSTPLMTILINPNPTVLNISTWGQRNYTDAWLVQWPTCFNGSIALLCNGYLHKCVYPRWPPTLCAVVEEVPLILLRNRTREKRAAPVDNSGNIITADNCWDGSEEIPWTIPTIGGAGSAFLLALFPGVVAQKNTLALEGLVCKLLKLSQGVDILTEELRRTHNATHMLLNAHREILIILTEVVIQGGCRNQRISNLTFCCLESSRYDEVLLRERVLADLRDRLFTHVTTERVTLTNILDRAWTALLDWLDWKKALGILVGGGLLCVVGVFAFCCLCGCLKHLRAMILSRDGRGEYVRLMRLDLSDSKEMMGRGNM